MRKIKDILGEQYPEFLKYCVISDKIYSFDISPSDYVAFRTQYGVSRDYINDLKRKIQEDQVGDLNSTDATSPVQVEKSEYIEEHQNCVGNDDCFVNQSRFVNNETDDSSKTGIEQKYLDELISKSNSRDDRSDEKKNNKVILYDIHKPLYVIFKVDDPEKYINIKIEAFGFKPKVERILKAEGKEFIFDVLRCSIAQLFDFNSISRTAIAKIIEQIKYFLSSDINSIDAKLNQVSEPLFKLFNIEELEQYKDISVESVPFSTRFANALMENKIDTLFLLLQVSIEDLRKWNHLGSTSIKDAIIQLDQYFKNPNRPIVKKGSKVSNTRKISVKVVSIVESELKGEVVSHDNLDEDELAFYSKIKEAIDICGEEFYFEIKNNPNYAKILVERLRNYYMPIIQILEKKDSIFQNYFDVSAEFKNSSVKSLYDIYKSRTNHSIDFLAEINQNITLAEIIKKTTNSESAEYYQSLITFLQWIKNIDITKIVEDIFSKNILMGTYKLDNELKDKYWLVLEMRAEGETLENIGSLIDATRERVRQIENKYTKQFALYYQNNEYDLLALIHVLCGENNVLTKSDIQNIIGEKHTNLLWLVLTKALLDCDMYKYSKAYDAVVFIAENKNNSESLNHVEDDLPEIFFEDQFDELVNDLSYKHNVSKELVITDIEKHFSKFGKLYSKSSPTVAFMCRYILKTKFQNGFKTGDINDTKRFQSYLIEFFGDDKGKMTMHALDSKIAQVGVLCDRGKYMHPEYLHIEKWIMEEINSYIEANSKTVITYSEIFDELRSVLNGTQITNRFMLQGALKFYGCKYKLAKDYITKESGKSLTDEFEDFARERGEFHKTDLFAFFPAMTDANLAMLISRCKNVFSIDNGNYMHSSVLHLTNEDYNNIRKYLNDNCTNGPINSRYLFDVFSCLFVDFMSRNAIFNHTKLFGILNYMFGEEFVFSRPYISKDENTSLTNRNVILNSIKEMDTITIEDLVALCQERGIKYVSSGYLIKQLSPDFIRINEGNLMRYEATGINDDVILEVVAYVANCIDANKYCSIATIKDFIWFPTICIEWTTHLIEAVMYLSGDMIKRINIPTTNLNYVTSIYVNDEFIDDDYITFILKIVDDAFEKGFFTSKNELREFLFEKGLTSNNSLPNFLEGSEYYYTNEEGILQRRK